MTKEQKQGVVDILLDFAPLFDELTTSDLQGVAEVEAEKVVKIVEKVA